MTERGRPTEQIDLIDSVVAIQAWLRLVQRSKVDELRQGYILNAVDRLERLKAQIGEIYHA